MNSIIIAFAMYSRIPMPRVDWNDRNMKYAICYFPVVGLLIGILELIFYSWCRWLDFGVIFRTSMLVFIPVFLTGGIHVDGFIDTTDAKSSWGDQEKKREILKDAHVGAFGVIDCIIYFILMFGAYSELSLLTVRMIAVGFVLSRSFSGLAVITFPLSKEEGLLAGFSKRAQKIKVCIIMYMYIIICAVFMVVIEPVAGIFCIVTSWITFCYYKYFLQKKFGGNSGDLAGWFLQICELVLVITAVIAEKIVSYL